MNSVNLIGRMVQEPDLRTSQNGKESVSFTLACQKTKDITDFVPCKAWESIAKTICQYVHKGEHLGVSGRISTRNCEKDGQKHYITEVIVDKIDLLGSKERKSEESSDEFPWL